MDRLVALRPDLVLVERSVARGAQEELLERGISLALNCKRSVLNMLARCTGAEVRGCCALLGTCHGPYSTDSSRLLWRRKMSPTAALPAAGITT